MRGGFRGGMLCRNWRRGDLCRCARQIGSRRGLRVWGGWTLLWYRFLTSSDCYAV